MEKRTLNTKGGENVWGGSLELGHFPIVGHTKQILQKKFVKFALVNCEMEMLASSDHGGSGLTYSVFNEYPFSYPILYSAVLNV